MWLKKSQTGRDLAVIRGLSAGGAEEAQYKGQETIMRVVTAFVAALAVLGVVIATGPARADDDDYGGDWRQHQWQEHQWREQRWRAHEERERAWYTYAPPPIAYPAPGYYIPQPTYYAPPPAYHAVPPSAYYIPSPPSTRL